MTVNKNESCVFTCWVTPKINRNQARETTAEQERQDAQDVEAAGADAEVAAAGDSSSNSGRSSNNSGSSSSKVSCLLELRVSPVVRWPQLPHTPRPSYPPPRQGVRQALPGPQCPPGRPGWSARSPPVDPGPLGLVRPIQPLPRSPGPHSNCSTSSGFSSSVTRSGH